MKTRLLTSMLGVCILFSLLHSPLHAQTNSVDVEQTVIAIYGSSLTFNAKAAIAAPVAGARLTIQVLNRPAQTVISVPAAANGGFVSASHTIPVTELELPPAATLTYRWEFEDTTGNSYSGSPATSRYADNRVAWEWTAYQQDNIVSYDDGTDPTVSTAVSDIAAASLASTSQLLGATVPGEVQIYVYPSLAAMANSLRSHQLVIQDWVAAYAIPDQQVIFVAAESGPDMLINLQRDLPHEITHLVVYAAAGGNINRIPGWLNEGLALTASPEPDIALQNILSDAIQNRILLSVETLCVSSFAGMSPRDAGLAYAQSASLVSYIRERYGASQINALLAAYASGRDCSSGVQLVFGIPLSALESQWQAYLSTSAVQPSSSSRLAAWLVVWAVSIMLASLFIPPQPKPVDNRPLSDTRLSLPRVPSEDT